MSQKGKTRKALILSAISLVLSFSMLLGTTFAWFTDSVTSENNIIQSGTLKATLSYQKGSDWVDASTAKVFDYQLWEPGYVDVKTVRVGNAGTLAFKYKLNVLSKVNDDAAMKLAEVIDVYVFEGTASREAIKGMTPVGTLKDLMTDPDGAAYGYLLPKEGVGASETQLPGGVVAPKGEVVLTIGLKMQETAGNDYMDLIIGGAEGFNVQLLATQLEYEKDSFGPEYDADAEYPFGAPFEVNKKAYYDFATAWAAINEEGGAFTAHEKLPGLTETLEVKKDITINGNGFTLYRGDSFTGTMFKVASGATLTLEDITVDGGAVWTGNVDPTLQRGTVNSGVTATGNLIATENNARIVLNKGAILQNNAGAHAVNLGTRIGATLTLNGGEIINNQSDSGAIWGGGHITVNSGKINGNSSTGPAGAIRMVSSCNLTMNDGEISNNKAAGDGGAIWGYGSSTYNFNGGQMTGNEAGGTGGAIYSGTYSVINISGDFELSDNKAADSGAIRLTDHTSMNMTGGKVSGNTQNGESNAFNTWNNSISITGGELSDDMSFAGGLGLTIGAADIDGIISYDLSTNHNTAYLAADFNGFKFTVNETATNFANFNFKPAAGYTYTAGDEAKLVCMNEGYETYWDAATETFRLQAK